MKKIKESYIFSFDKNTKPIAYIDDGETIIVPTLDCYSGKIKTAEDKDLATLDDTNPATGPIYINGAKAGDVLKIDIIDIKVDKQGVSCTIEDCGVLWKTSELRTKVIPIKDNKAYFNDLSWPINPMIGVIGTAPKGQAVSTGDSFECGGNMDNPTITRGTSVYLPVQVDGGLLALGDLHATMGEGEVVGTGIEIAGEVTIKVSIIKDFKLNWPVNKTENAWFVNTNGINADVAIERGYLELQRLIAKAYDWDNTDAAIYISLQGLLRANQACLGIHSYDNEGPTFRVGCPIIDKPLIK